MMVWVLGSKMGLASVGMGGSFMVTRSGHGRRHHGVGLSEYSLSLCLASHFPFFFIFYFYFLKIYLSHGLLPLGLVGWARDS